MISLDFEDGENRYRLEPWHDATPEKIFERQWALSLLEQELRKLRAEFDANGKNELFNGLTMFLGSPFWLLTVLILLKIGMAVRAHLQERKRFAAGAEHPAVNDTVISNLA